MQKDQTTPPEGITAAAISAVAAVQSAVAQLLERRTQVETRISELEHRLGVLYDAPLSLDCVIQFHGELIDFRAQKYVEEAHECGLLGLLAKPVRAERGVGKPPLNMSDAEFALGRISAPEGRPSLAGNGWELPLFPMIQGRFIQWPYFLFGDLMKEKMADLLREMVPDVGVPAGSQGIPSLSERREEIERINFELNSLRSDFGSIQREIAALAKPVADGAKSLSYATQVKG